MSKVGNLLKELRGKESLREASKRIGISHTYLDTIEKGYDKRSGKPVNPTPDTLRMISKAYDYPYRKLLILAGYIEEDNNDNFDSLAALKEIVDELGIEDLFFHNIDDLKNLTPEDVEEIRNHFEYVTHKAKKRKEKADK